MKNKTKALVILLLALISAPSQAKVSVGETFPPIELPLLSSKTGAKTEMKQVFTSKQVAGKVVLVDFWGSDCPPCRLALPKLDELYKKYRASGFVILGVNVDADPEDTRAFLDEYKVTYPLPDDQKHRMVPKMGVTIMPTSFLVDRKGVVRYIHRGFKSGDAARLEAEIKRWLGGKAQKDD